MNASLEAYAQSICGVSLDKLSVDQRIALNKQYQHHLLINKQESKELAEIYQPPSVMTYFSKFKSLSASQILSQEPSLYDPFLFPCSSNSYIPNERLRELRDLIENGDFSVAALEESDLYLQSKFMYLQSWAPLKRGSESELLDPYVNSVVLDEIAKHFNQSNDSPVFKIKDAVPFDPVMCKSVKSEYRLDFTLRQREFVLLTSECKGSTVSQFVGLVQGLEIAADSAIHMCRSTALASKECSIPGVLVYADVVQFYGVYLVHDFPVIVYLTPPLSYSNVENRKIIVRAIFSCVQYLQKSVHLLQSTIFNDDRLLRPLKFNYDDFFYKPIKMGRKTDGVENVQYSGTYSASFIGLERIMYTYQKISVVKESSKYVLFPSGLLRIPGRDFDEFASIVQRTNKYFFCDNLHLVPIILFPYLGDWTNNKPPSSHNDKYIEVLTQCVDIFNTAKVAHMDLRPANIMWRVTAEKGFELQIIDFEDAVSFGCKIRSVQELINDSSKRYPPMETKELYFASSYHNYWFLVCVIEWLRIDVHEENFEGFMRLHRESVCQKFDDFILTHELASNLKV